MKTLLTTLIAIVTAAWGWDIITTVSPAGVHPLWFARQEALYLSGLLSIALMSLVMLLATRPAWLESPLGGMDRVTARTNGPASWRFHLPPCIG